MRRLGFVGVGACGPVFRSQVEKASDRAGEELTVMTPQHCWSSNAGFGKQAEHVEHARHQTQSRQAR